ncbi:GTP-binding protein [Thalassospira sp. NFXS8]|jgi:flagellar biosynthesis protein FlhF|uniref:flagellar biosynthesis protein FlhF n=1 Tax=Thalassospira sp. NFXS8 TaxID=2819093 RepID=UPI0032DF4224
MRLKTFTAPTMSAAMALVKEHMGADAIIVSTQDIPGSGVRLTAAIDSEPEFEMGAGGINDDATSGPTLGELIDEAEAALIRHSVPERLRLRLCDAMGRERNPGNVQQLLASALDEIFEFTPLPEKSSPRAIAFVGTPGAGKTLCVAKAAARAVMKKRRVAVLTSDTKRAGGVDQLRAFTKILKIPLGIIKSPEDLREQFDASRGADLVFVDTANCNPYIQSELATLSEFLHAVPSEPILVCPAGVDAEETGDIANAFAECGTTRMLITRLDVASRLGGALYGADTGNLSLCNVSMTAQVADGLTAISPVALAKLLIPARHTHKKTSFAEVMK